MQDKKEKYETDRRVIEFFNRNRNLQAVPYLKTMRVVQGDDPNHQERLHLLPDLSRKVRR